MLSLSLVVDPTVTRYSPPVFQFIISNHPNSQHYIFRSSSFPHQPIFIIMQTMTPFTTSSCANKIHIIFQLPMEIYDEQIIFHN